MRRLCLAAGLVGLVLALLADPAPAQAPDAQGWWYVAGSPLGIAPPYVPEEGLYVASNPSGPEAVSALRFTLAGGGAAGTLQLQVAGEIRGTPVVGVCAVAEPWEPGQAGQLMDAPACEAGAVGVPGTVAEDGTSVSFPVATLVRDGVLDVAIVPGQDASGVNPTFQLAFEKPGPEALPPSGDASGSPSSSPGEPAPAFEPAPSPAIEPPPPSSSAADFVPEPPSAPLTGSAPRPEAPSPAFTDDGGLDAAFGDQPPRAGAPAGDDGNDGPRIAGFVLLAGTALVYHRLSTTPDRAPRSLVTFGQLSAEEPP
jgi:hypothetical protein